MPAPAKKGEPLSVFGDKSACPTRTDLQHALGPAGALWDDLVAHIGQAYGPIGEQWSFSGARFGWSLRLKKGDRIILYLIPQAGRFLAGIVLGAKAVAAAQDADLPSSILRAIAEAPKYAEGTGLRLPVAAPSDLQPIQQLAAFKMAR